MKLAQKLTLCLVLGMCVVLLLDCWLSIKRELQLQAADMRHDDHVAGQGFASAFTELWVTNGRARALKLVDDVNAVFGQPYLRWIDLGASPAERSAAPVPAGALAALGRGNEFQTTVQARRDDGRFFSYVPVRIDGRIVGGLELSESLAGNDLYIRSTLMRRLITLMALCGLSGLIAILLGAAFVGRPMRKLAVKTQRIALGDLSTPLDLHQRDEIGELGREIDAMCVKLADARERIEAETKGRIDAVERMRHSDRLATVGTLASGVAHELGTPLNVVLQRAKMIANGDVAGAEAVDGARIIADQTRRMVSVIRQLLDFARRHIPNKARQDLRLVARQTVQLLAPLAERRGVRLEVEGDDRAAYADIDAPQIQQALTNLVVNGIQAETSGGQVTITIEVRRMRPPADHGGAEGRYVRLAVRDGGPGIPPEHLPHVFEPFFTTKQAGEGTGLGLAVANGIVRDHGGWMELDSGPGRGSCFSICLPSDAESARSTSAAPVVLVAPPSGADAAHARHGADPAAVGGRA